MQPNLNHQTAAIRVSRARQLILRLLLALLAGCLPAISARAASDSTLSSNRFLCVFDISAPMHKQAAAVRKAFQDFIDSRASGQLHYGDTIGIWSFDSELHTGYLPLQVWASGEEDEITLRIQEFIKQQPVGSASHLGAAMDGIKEIAASPDMLTVLIFSTGESPISGTPFDDAINAEYQRDLKDMGRARMPIVTVLQARHGKFLKYTVNALPWPIVIPELPIAIKMATAKPAVAVPAAQVAPVPVMPAPKPAQTSAAEPPPPTPAPAPMPLPAPASSPNTAAVSPDLAPAPPPSMAMPSPAAPVTAPLRTQPKPAPSVAPMAAVSSPPLPPPPSPAPVAVLPPPTTIPIPPPRPVPTPVNPPTPAPQAIAPKLAVAPTTGIKPAPVPAPVKPPIPVPTVAQVPAGPKAPDVSAANSPAPKPVTPPAAVAQAAAVPPNSILHPNSLLIAGGSLFVIAGLLIVIIVRRNRVAPGPSLITRSLNSTRK